MIETFVAVLVALLVRDLIRPVAAALDWRWSVNKGFGGHWLGVPTTNRTPIHVLVARALSGRSQS
jgi:hypothetical protein